MYIHFNKTAYKKRGFRCVCTIDLEYVHEQRKKAPKQKPTYTQKNYVEHRFIFDVLIKWMDIENYVN